MRKLGQNNIDRIFEEGLQDVEMRVSGNVWAGIHSELEKDQLRRKVFFYRSIAAASVALLIGLTTWMLAFQTKDAIGVFTARAFTSRANLPTLAAIDCAPEELHPQPIYTKDLPFPILKSPARYASKVAVVVTTKDKPIDVKNALGDLMESSKMGHELVPGLEEVRMHLQARTPMLSNPFAETGQLPLNSFALLKSDVAGESRKLLKPDGKKDREFSFAALETEDAAVKAPGRWEVGAGFAPDMAFASTTPLGQGSRNSLGLADDPAQAKTNRLSPVMAYAAVVRASYELDDRFSIRAGLSCINRQTSTFASANTFGKNATTYQSNLNLYTLEVPVSLKYNVIHAKSYDYYVTTGVSGNFFLHYENYLQTSQGDIVGRRSSSATEVLKPSQASLLLSTGLRYRLHDRLSMQLEPGLRYGVMRNEYAFSQRRPLSTSLLSGLSYHF
jgi:hypothetical protein